MYSGTIWHASTSFQCMRPSTKVLKQKPLEHITYVSTIIIVSAGLLVQHIMYQSMYARLRLSRNIGTMEHGNSKDADGVCSFSRQAKERAWCALRNAPDSAVSCAVMSASGGDSARSASALRSRTHGFMH